MPGQSARRPRTARCALALGALTFLLASALPAQDDKPAARDDKPSPRADKPRDDVRPEKTTLFLIVRTGPDLSKELIEKTLVQGMKIAECTSDGPPSIKPITPWFYEELESTIKEVESKTSSPTEASEKKSGVFRLPTREALWELRLEDPTLIIKTLTVTCKPDKEIKMEPKKPKDGSRPDLALMEAGRYAIRLEPKLEPISYKAVAVDIEGHEKAIAGTWPASDHYYAITLKKFEGNRKKLFEVIQDEKLVKDPLDDIRVGRDVLFVFADLGATEALVDDGLIDGNELIARLPGVKKRDPKRVWILFPLNEEQMKSQLTKLRDGGDKALAESIEKGKVEPNEKVTITADMEPRSFQVPLNKDSRVFERRIPLDVAKLADLQKKFPRAYRLVVWDFNSTGPTDAITVQHPQGGKVPVLEQEVKGWPLAIEELAKKKGSK